LPWKVGDFVFRNMNKIDEFTSHFHNLNLKYAERIRGFDPNGIFVGHMLTMGFSSSFIHTVLGEEEENNLGNPTHTAGDVETVLRLMNCINKEEKVPTRRVHSPQLLLPRLQHLEVVLQRPTHLRK
jgi:hypothetical protein